MATQFFDVEGTPVTYGILPDVEPFFAAWDVVPPRPFDGNSVFRKGVPIDRGAFLASLPPDVLDFAVSTFLSARLLTPGEARVVKAIEQFKKDTAGKTWDDLADEIDRKQGLGKPSV